MKYIYPVVFRPAENGFYAVSVPDLPGCFTQGKDLQDAYDMAQDAIALWICDSEAASAWDSPWRLFWSRFLSASPLNLRGIY